MCYPRAAKSNSARSPPLQRTTGDYSLELVCAVDVCARRSAPADRFSCRGFYFGLTVGGCRGVIATDCSAFLLWRKPSLERQHTFQYNCTSSTGRSRSVNQPTGLPIQPVHQPSGCGTDKSQVPVLVRVMGPEHDSQKANMGGRRYRPEWDR